MSDQSSLPVSTLRAYQVLCDFCATLFVAAPSKEMVLALADQADLLREEPFTSVAPEAASALADELEEAKQTDAQAFVKRLSIEYTRLFQMVGYSHTSPYESVYRTDDRTVFGPTTLEVREAYRRFDMEAPHSERFPDDHIGNEFAFMALLLDLAANARESASDEQEEKRALVELKSFLANHILVFAPIYLANLQTASRESFYGHVAEIAKATLKSLADTFDVSPSVILDERLFLLS